MEEQLRFKKTGVSSSPTIARIEQHQFPDPATTKFLIGEVSAINATVMRKFLEKLGYQLIVQVENGVQAVSAAESEKFDFIFLDVRMPVIGGAEATQLIRKYEKTINTSRHSTIVGLTTEYKMGKNIYIDCGMDCVLRMPLHFNSLKDVLSKYGGIPKSIPPLKDLILMYITNQPHLFQYEKQHSNSILYNNHEVYVVSDILEELHAMKEAYPPCYRYPNIDSMEMDEAIPFDYLILKESAERGIAVDDVEAVHRYARGLAAILRYVSSDASNAALEMANSKDCEQAKVHLLEVAFHADKVWQ